MNNTIRTVFYSTIIIALGGITISSVYSDMKSEKNNLNIIEPAAGELTLTPTSADIKTTDLETTDLEKNITTKDVITQPVETSNSETPQTAEDITHSLKDMPEEAATAIEENISNMDKMITNTITQEAPATPDITLTPAE